MADTECGLLPGMTVPIVGAPMAGGPTTAALVAAVSNAGGLGMLAAGYLGVEALAALVEEVEALTERPYGVNLFLGQSNPLTAQQQVQVDAYRARLAPIADELGVEPGEPIAPDEDNLAKIDLLADHRPSLVSVTFGAPSAELIDRARTRLGLGLTVTVTSADEARRAVALGAVALVAQGIDAGGHRGLWLDDPADDLGGPATSTTDLLTQVVAVAEGIPVIAAGGIVNNVQVAGLIESGAAAVQVGTALLLADEAGTSAVHRAALVDPRIDDTIITRAYSGKSARGLRTDFAVANRDAPATYPHIHHVTKPIRAAATRVGRREPVNLWAGTGWRGIVAAPAADIIAGLAGQQR